MRRRRAGPAARLLALLLLLAAAPAAAEPLLLFAGAATRPVIDAAIPAVRAALGIEVAVNYGGSGRLLTQLRLTHRGDLYLPGSHDFLERAVALGVVDPATRVDFAYLTPALLVAKGNPKGIHALRDLLRPGVRVALGEPRTVCAGAYGVRLLRRAHLAAPVLARAGRAPSCAAVANLLATGSVDAILGWRV
ncbi:MAG: molybdate ABC transporter substrate-binding protein, partial [Nitrospirae bacterium]